MEVPSFLLNDYHQRLLFFGGKGGVGKTTCAVAAALRLARCSSKESFLLVSTDPAHSLADSLADTPLPSNLDILELDAQECMATFKNKHNEDLREIASRGTFLDEEDIGQFLELSLPGLDELVAFLEISKWVEERSYDCIVVDTAPTGHTLRLLAMPELIGKWLEALDALLAKHRYMKKLFKGYYDGDELDEFLLELSDSVKQMQSLLRDPSCCRFVPVMLAEALSIYETVMLLDELERSKIPVTDIVVNRLYPESPCRFCTDRRGRQMRELTELPERFERYSIWGVPVFPQEILGARSLAQFWECLSAINIAQSETERAYSGVISPSDRVERSSDLPSPSKEILLFAGKGGVGKTTLACATALRVAQDFWNKEIFLFSTDPAHSLSDCLGVKVGPQPTRVTAGLTAMEIDAQAEFETLKDQYAEELAGFLGNISPNLDLTFDREVMERIMDLSPSGLDEVMALTLAMRFLAQNKYHVFVLDSAPTGHLIRLLELPELIDQWLKLFFNLFLKYKRVFRLPEISQRLVQMSKDLKQLRTLLIDPGRSALYAVSTLTEMAFQETKDLLNTCKRMGLCVPVLFQNLATPASSCTFCSALHRCEFHVKDKFQKTFSGLNQVLIYCQGEPRGLQRLGELGEALYKRKQKVSIAR